MAKWKKGERIKVTIQGNRNPSVGKLVKMEVTKLGNLSIELERDNGLPTRILAKKSDLTLEKVTDESTD